MEKHCYIISYDLGEGGDYGALFEAIKSYRTWAHITESMWAVVSSKSAEEIRDHLYKSLPSESRLIVIRSGVESAWYNVICRDSWLQENL